MFGMFSNPQGAEYNVPFQNIRPPGNQVNIDGGQTNLNQGDAFAAFSRYWMPWLQNQSQLAGEMSLGNMPPEVQRAGMRFGEQPPQPYQQPGEQDFQSALANMFQRQEDAGTLNKYRGFSSQGRRLY